MLNNRKTTLPASNTKRQKVLICGGGPVGLALAIALARYDVASVVVEADTDVCAGSRAICLSRRSLEILDRLGVLEPFVDKGLGWTTGRSYYRQSEILRFDMPHDRHQRLLPMTNLQQFYVERFLVEKIEALSDLIELRWGTSVEHVSRHDDHVSVELKSGDTHQSLEAEWLIACDGARSTVRQQLGLRMNGTAYEGRYVIADIEIDLDLPTERLAWFDPQSNPGRTMLMHRQPDNIWRLDYQLHDGEDAEAMIRPESVIPRIEAHLAMMGQTAPWRLIWSSSYKASALSLDDYVHGRVIFAGDAAHLVPIFGVRGLNSGFDDAFNLAWKLAYVLNRRAGPELLASFTHERHLAWRTNIAHAMKSTEFMAPPSRGFALMRDAVLSLAGDHPELRSLINPRQSSVIHYEGSPLSTLTSDDASFASGPAPGGVAPECPLLNDAGAQTFLTRELGDDFTLIVATEPGDVQRLRVESATLKLLRIVLGDAGASVDAPAGAFRDSAGRFAELFDARPQAVYLVRPDGHICARWRSFKPREIAQAIDRACRVTVTVDRNVALERSAS